MRHPNGLWQRAAAVLASAALTAAMCAPVPAQAASTAATYSPVVSVKAQSFGNGAAQAPATLAAVKLDSRWLAGLGSGTYNAELATWASVIATATYESSVVSAGSVQASAGFEQRLGQLLDAYGFQDVEYRAVTAGSASAPDQDDATAVLMAHKPIATASGQVDAYLLAVQGTSGQEEQWLSNFDVGDTRSYGGTQTAHPDWKTEEHHKGFDVAAARVDRVLAEYMAATPSSAGGAKTLLLTGHSRGAAIANILGAEYEHSTLAGAPAMTVGAYGSAGSYHKLAAVQTYTFASPAVTTGSAERSSVFNICNADDFIPAMPLESWGFKRYGTDVVLSVAASDAAALLFEHFTGTEYASPRVEALVGLFERCAGSREGLYEATAECAVQGTSRAELEAERAAIAAAAERLGAGSCVELGAVTQGAGGGCSFTKAVKPQFLLTGLALVCANSSKGLDALVPLLSDASTALKGSPLESVFSGIVYTLMQEGGALYCPHYTATYYSIAALQEEGGAELALGNATYALGSVAARSACYTAPTSSAAKKSTLAVPQSVSVAGKGFAVTGIAPRAFAGAKATKLVIRAQGLSKKSLRNCLKGSKVQRVVVQAYKNKAKNRAYALKLKSWLAKSNSGRNVKITY
ncbi:MAG: hypothetical protein ACI36Y_09715 [Coriobacteriales bacterium]